MKIAKMILKIFGILLGCLLFAYLILLISTKPSNDRNWSPDQAVLPDIEMNAGMVSIKNIRNFEYRSTSDYTPRYYNATFDLSKIKQAYYIVEPFAGQAEGAAHTFLSFEFEDGQFVSISVEIRKEKGESFSALKGILRQYELVYVIADERDVVKLRSNFRKDDVFLYPIQMGPEKTRDLFVSMLTRAKAVQEDPEFYNTATNTCTTNIVDHAREISDVKLPRFHKAFLLPAYSDILAQELGFIDTTLPIDELRSKHRINELAEKYADDPGFSLRIRGR